MKYDQWKVMNRFADRFRVKPDPNEPDRLPKIDLKRDRGHIYVQGANRLGAFFRSRASMIRAIAAEFPFTDVAEGDGEHQIFWPVDHPDAVRLMDRIGALRRPRVSEATKRAATDRIRRVNDLRKARNGVQNQRNGAWATQTPFGAI